MERIDRGVATVRAAAAHDAATIQAIYAVSMADAAWLPESAKQNTSFAAVSEGEVIYVAEDAGANVVGFISVYPAESFVHHLYVQPGMRGQSVGRGLLNSLQDWLLKPWCLKCVRKNTGALRFYARNGWQEMGSGVSEQGEFVILALASNPRSPPEPGSVAE